MGVVRDRMAVDLRLRGLSPVTQRLYLRCAERFVAYHRGPSFPLPGHPGLPRGGAAHPVPPPGDRAIAGDPEPRGGRAAVVRRPPAQAPGDADGGLRGRPPGERAVRAVADRYRFRQLGPQWALRSFVARGYA